jgi:hypothetical protein
VHDGRDAGRDTARELRQHPDRAGLWHWIRGGAAAAAADVVAAEDATALRSTEREVGRALEHVEKGETQARATERLRKQRRVAPDLDERKGIFA